MFEKIYSNQELFQIITSYCEENGLEVCLSPTLDDENILILKADEFYSSKNIHNPPPAVDCIILVKCQKECYDIYLVELKNIKSPKGFDKENIVLKFKNVITDFLENRFKDIFLNENYCNFNCYFITNLYRCENMSQEEFDKKIKSQNLKLDYFNSIKPFKFKNKIAFIKPIIPNPTIKEC